MTCAEAVPGLIAVLDQATAEDIETLTDLAYEGLAGAALRMPVKKPEGGELTDAQQKAALVLLPLEHGRPLPARRAA